jgi:(2R)-sulfolactate sulfo-lyase subunit alpha
VRIFREDDEGAMAVIHFLVHDAADTVGVAVLDIKAGTLLSGRDLSTNKPLKAKSEQDIPLGHKLALKDLALGETVIEYGCEIGRVVQPIKAGQHVHVHNVKTKRWA